MPVATRGAGGRAAATAETGGESYETPTDDSSEDESVIDPRLHQTPTTGKFPQDLLG